MIKNKIISLALEIIGLSMAVCSIYGFLGFNAALLASGIAVIILGIAAERV
tara:strand:- start:1749 stop:1901 length:153 start_codon:yes stop_codon:yes gene_type:complete